LGAQCKVWALRRGSFFRCKGSGKKVLQIEGWDALAVSWLGRLPAEISSTGNCPKQIMVASVSSCAEFGAFVYTLWGQLPGADGFPDRGLFDKLSWFAKTNRMSYLSQPRGEGGVS